MKNLIEKINEAKEVKYRVSLIGAKNEDTPINVTILVDSNDTKAFEKYLEDEQDNIFAHAEGGNIEY